MGTITIRLPDALVRELDEVSRIEQLNRSTVLRRLLAKSIQEWRLERALELYAEQKFSFGQATSYSGISVWEFNELLLERRIPRNYGAAELRQDLETAEQWKR